MEYPSFNHHHHNNRYVPHDFPDDHHRNPYPHRLPPPPQSHPPYPSLPPPPPLPPPPYNQPHFTFLNPHPHRSPIDRDSSKSPSFLNRHPPHRQSSPLRFSNRSLYEEDDNHRNRIPPPQQLNFPKFDYRPDPPPRFPPPEPSHRPRLPSPYHPSDPQIRELDLDRISPAFRDDFIDTYASRNNNININSSRISQNRENIIRGGPRNEGHDDGGYRRDNGRSPDRRRFLRDLELGLGSRSPREDFGGNYESRRGEKERSWKLRDEDFQRDRSWIARRDEDRRRLLRDTVKDGDFGGSRDEIPSVSGREERNSYEPGKSSNRASEFREEFVQSSSPMKQIQKKSVLLRIGKPNNAIRNRSRDQHFSKAYFDDPTNISFKGKDKERESVPCLDQSMEEEKVGSPVELNVTFKSNALVAKAVVPPSSPAVGSDRNFTPPRNRKIRRITESDSPLTRAVEQSVKSDSSSYGSDCPSSSEKTLKKLAKNYNVCGDGPVWNMNSLPCSTATNGSTRNGAVDSPSGSITDQGGKGKSYDKSRSDRTRKKNKAILLAADASMQRPTRKDSKPVEGYKYGPSALNEGAMQDVSFASLDGTFVAEMKKPPEDIMQGKDGTVNDTGSPCELDNERNSLSHLASSSGPQVNKIDQIPENTDTLVPYFQFISNSDTIPSEIQSGSTECNIDGTENVNLSPSHLQLLENDNAKVSLESVVRVEGTDHDVLPSREEIQFHESPVGLSAVASATFKSPSSFDESSMRQEISSIVDMSSIGSKTFCLNELTTVTPDGVAEGSSNALPANAEEIIAHEDLLNLVSLNQDPSITSSFIGGLTNTQAEKIISDTSILGDTGKSAYFDGASELLKNDPAEGSPVDKILTGDSQSVSSSQAYPSDGLDLQLGSSSPRICQTPENVGRPMLDIDATSSYSLKDIAITEDEVSRSKEENVADVHAIQEHDSQCTEIDNLTSSSAMEILSPDRSLPSTVVESDILAKDDLLHASNIPSVCADVASLSATKAANKHVPVMLIHLVTPETVSTSSDSCTLNNKSLDCMTSGQKLGEYGNELQEKPLSGGGSVVTSSNTSANNFKSNMISSPAKVTAVAINTKTALSASQVFNKTTQNLNSGKGAMHVARNQPTAASGIRRVFTGPSPSVLTNSSTKAPAQQIAKTRTWHRTGKASNFPLPVKKSFSSPVPPPPKRVGMAQSSSYIRTGNTLVRKPTVVTALPSGTPASSSSIFRSSPSGIDEAKKTAGLASKVDVIGAAGSLRTGGLSAPIERPKTPPVLHSSKSSDCIPIDSGDVTSLPLNCPPVDGSRIISNHMLTNHLNVPKMPEEKMNSSGIPERQTSLTCNSQSQNILDEGTLEKKIRYVKRKSNQLVAASNSGDPPVLDVDKIQASLSDGYYKKRKNQLIRTSAGSHVMQRVASPDDPVYSEMGHAAEVNSSKSLIKKQSNKGKAKIYKHSRFSSVWTLNNQSSRKNGVSLHCQKVWPHLIPWKRAKDWRSFVSMSASASNNSSLSLISQKLLLSRKRDTIYTRSSHGFSLHMSKLLSVGGSSLKWSKSIEKNSKRANEEATLAVAAVEKEKREQNGTSRLVPGSKSRNNISRERIFRIGLVRYRMDPSRRTLQRISDEEPSISRQPGKEGKRSYVPRRLLIGHDEYVRIGNGNQLVRDPKKRTRIFANEKVRWSLHTARLRLARKRKYCQFFTRFGKCNKDGGKCPYIHDPSKIAVCTKFLNGSCSDPNCKLTHKVIPERMQDCSYFLQGLCSNEHCPYRHVNVNTNASACEGFLKGYCADGNECRKKHTYVCPIFEATGICPQGSTCKLHHPKKRSGLKRKQQSMEQQQKNARGRYFGSRRNAGVVAEDVAASPGNLGPKDDDDIFSQDGKFSDYIDVDMSDEETDGNCDLTSERRTILADPSYLQVVDIDDMIKPIGIMNRNLLTESLLSIDSPSEKSASFLSEESDVCK